MFMHPLLSSLANGGFVTSHLLLEASMNEWMNDWKSMKDFSQAALQTDAVEPSYKQEAIHIIDYH